MLSCAILVSQAACQTCGSQVHFTCECAHTIFIELEAARGERITFYYIAASFKKARMNFFDDAGFCEHEVFVAAFSCLPAKIFCCELIALYIGTHCSIVD